MSGKKHVIVIPKITRERLKAVALVHALELPFCATTNSSDWTLEQYEQVIIRLKPLASRIEGVAALLRELNYYRRYGHSEIGLVS